MFAPAALGQKVRSRPIEARSVVDSICRRKKHNHHYLAAWQFFFPNATQRSDFARAVSRFWFICGARGAVAAFLTEPYLILLGVQVSRQNFQPAAVSGKMELFNLSCTTRLIKVPRLR